MAVDGMIYRDINAPLQEGDIDPTGGIKAAADRDRQTDEMPETYRQTDEMPETQGTSSRESVRALMAKSASKESSGGSTRDSVRRFMNGEPEAPRRSIGESAWRATKETGAAVLGHAAGAANMIRNMVGTLGAGGEMAYRTIEQEVEGFLTGKPQDHHTEADMDKIMDSWTRQYDISDVSPRAQEHKQKVEHIMEEFIKPFSEAKEAYMDQAVTPVPVVDMDGKVVAYSRPYPVALAAIGGAGLELGGSIAMIELPLAGVRLPFKGGGKPLRMSKGAVGDLDVVTMPSMTKNLLEVEARARHVSQRGPQAGSFSEGIRRAESGMTGDYQGATGTPGDIWKAQQRARKGPVETPLPKSDVLEQPTIIDAKTGTVDTIYKTKTHDPVQFQKNRAAREAADAGGGTLYTGGVYKQSAKMLKDIVDRVRKGSDADLVRHEAKMEVERRGFLPNENALKRIEYPNYANIEGHQTPVDTWYHGTQADFKVGEFADTGVKRGTTDPISKLGTHFAQEYHVAEGFAEGLYGKDKGKGRVIESRLKVRNPRRFEFEGDLRDAMAEYITGEKPGYHDGIDVLRGMSKGKLNAGIAKYKRYLKSKGHDGIIYGNVIEGAFGSDSVIVLDPKNIVGKKVTHKPSGAIELYTGGAYEKVGQGLKKIWDEITQGEINNASGNNPASIEALNRLAQQHDMLFFRTNANNPKVLEQLIPTVDRVDLRAMKDQIIFAKKIGDPRIIHIESGANLRRGRSTQILEGIQQRANKGTLSHGAYDQFFSGAGYQKAAEVVKDLMRKLRDNQRVHKAHDAFYVEPRFERLNGHETAFHAKNVNSLSGAIIEDGIRKMWDQVKDIKDPKILEEAVLLAEQPSRLKGRANTPAGKVAQWMRKEFDNAQALLKENGIEVNFKERMQQTLTAKLRQSLDIKNKTKTDRIKINRYKRALEKLDDFEFVSIPKNMWMESLLENPITENKALRLLTTRQRRVLRISDMQKFLGKKTNVVDVMSAYYQKIGNDIALSKVFQSALDEGLATLSPKEGKAMGYRKLPANEAPSFAKYYMHDVLRNYLKNEFITRTRPSTWGQLASTVKMMTFDSPWYLGYYNIHQAAMLRGWKSMVNPKKGTLIGEYFKARKMIRESHPEVMMAKEYGLQSTPYPKQVENLIKDMHRANQGIFKRSFSMFQDMAQSTMHPIKHFKQGKGIGRIPIVSDFYSAAWDIAWNNFDFPVRMTSYNYLRELGMSARDAAQTAARFHGDYAAIPRNMRVKLNKVLYTPTFKLAMAKLHGEILSSAIKGGGTAGPVGFKLGRGKALGAIGTVLLTNLFFDQMMTRGFGFERKFFGRRYSKNVETDKGVEELNVTFSSPQNFTFKYAERLSKMFKYGFDPKTAEQAFRANKYEITPLLTILNDAVIKNQDATGNVIYNNYDDKSTKWKKSAWYAAREINSHLKMLYPDKEGVAAKKAMAEEMGSSLSFLIRTMANGYLTPTEIERLNRHMENAERNYSEDLNNSVENNELSREKIQELTDNYLKDLSETMGKM